MPRPSDLLLTDPPYGIGEAAGKNKSRGKLAIAQDYGDLGWDDATPTEDKRVHPTQKPLALMKWCLSLFPDATSVLDPYLGSGTTLVAAKAMGLTGIGIEMHEPYCEIAAKRLSQEVFDFSSSLP